MRILYINHYAGSPKHGMEFRPYYLAREWTRSGHQVKIIAADQSHIRRTSPDLGSAEYLDDVIDGVQYRWLRTPAYNGNGIGRVINMVAFIKKLYFESKKIAGTFNPDLVIASSTYPLDIWPAQRIAKAAGARLVFEVHDLWPLTPVELGGMSRWHPFVVMLQVAENYAYRHADVIVSILPKIGDYLRERGHAIDNLHIVPNGIDPAEWHGDPAIRPGEAENLVTALRASGRSIIGYAGGHGVSNALGNLLEVAKIMRNEKVVFVLVGDGSEKLSLQQRCSAENIDNVVFVDSVPKSQIPRLIGSFDIAYIGWRRHSLYRFGVSPNKLMDYMMASRPIVHAVIAGNDLVSETKCGKTVFSENPVAAVDAIRNLLAETQESRSAMGKNGRDFVLRNLTYPVLAARFLEACH